MKCKVITSSIPDLLVKNKHSILSKTERERRRKSRLTIKTVQTEINQLNTTADGVCRYVWVKNVFTVFKSGVTYLMFFDWFRSVWVRLRTLFWTFLPSLVVLLVTTHSDEQMSQSSFLVRLYSRIIWFTQETRLPLIWQTTKQNRRTSASTLFVEATHQNGAFWIPGMPIDLDHNVLWGTLTGGLHR